MKFDIEAYGTLLLKIFALEERLRKDPPTNVEEYIALVGQIGAYYQEARTLMAQNRPTAADIAAAHARNQTVWSDRKPKSAPTDDPYAGDLAAYPDKTRLKPGDVVWQLPNGKFHVQPSGVGMYIPPEWRQIEVIGG
jgi:hypothetical protein